MSARTFGYRPSPPDARDQVYLMDVPHRARTLPVRKTWRMPRPPMDQGDRPHCVAYAWTAMLLAAPITGAKFLPSDTAGGVKQFTTALYTDARTVDGLDDAEDGTTVRGAAKALKARGMLAGYLWGYDAEAIAGYVLTRGPVVLGVNWYAGFSDADMGVMRRMCAVGRDTLTTGAASNGGSTS